jgi:hypothetical protein
MGARAPASANPLLGACNATQAIHLGMPHWQEASSDSSGAVRKPKLSAVATLDSFATRLEEMMEARGMRTVIDADAKALGSE